MTNDDVNDQNTDNNGPRRFDRSANVALGLVIGVGLALLLFVVSVPEFRDPSQLPGGSDGFWATYTVRQDTYAQWIMALFSVASAVISVWAVLLVRDTLEVNRRATIAAESAVSVAGEIGQAQTRAYLTAEPIEIPPLHGSDIDSPYNFNVSFRNVGQSPARNLRHIAMACWQYRTLPTPCPDLVKPKTQAEPSAVMLAAGAIVETEAISDLKLKDLYLEDNCNKNKIPTIFGIVWYDDVFGKSHKLRFAFQIEIYIGTDRLPEIGDEVNIRIRFKAANSHNDET